jgi:hypothetical protein
MTAGRKTVLALSTVIAMAGTVFAHPNFTGYSGAPGCRGTCASSCHGTTGGTITTSGFPTAYAPGQVYTITVAHSGGNPIANFNASCRVDTGSTNAGTLAAGLNTTIYSATGESNGVHFTTAFQDSGKFTWTAPSGGTGAVRLYVAGHQGTTSGEDNTELVLVSSEASGVEQGGKPFTGAESFGLRPGANPAKGAVVMAYQAGGPALLKIYDLGGRTVRSFAVAGNGLLRWDGRDAKGKLASQGAYLFRLEQGTRSATRKALLIR